MPYTLMARRGAVTAPHHLAAQAGLAVLRDGGNAIEAAVAAAAAIAVVYPHMNGIGGDGFWLIAGPGKAPIAIDACGAAGAGVDAEMFLRRGLDKVPWCGPLSAFTVAGTVSGWQAALEISADWGGRMSLRRLLADAIDYAAEGFPVPVLLNKGMANGIEAFAGIPGFADYVRIKGQLPAVGARFTQPALARTLERLARAGLDGFYRGKLGREIAAGLARAGIPLSSGDLARQRARRVRPLSLKLAGATVYNLPPPTQGLASLMILGLFERLGVREAEGFDFVHGLVEAVKQAYIVRDAHIADPASMKVDPREFLEPAVLDRLAKRIDRARALRWPHEATPADTIWLGTMDGEGRGVSFIQSLFSEWGSGVYLPETGIVWQNRAKGFSLKSGHPNRVRAGRKPFHTLNPAMARFNDGRLMVYGTRGADGQPQTQSALFTRYALFGQPLQEAAHAPRWALGLPRRSNLVSHNLKLEGRFAPAVIAALRKAGHDVEVVADFDNIMGHVGALVRHRSGLIEGAVDPRSDGVVAAF